MARNRKRETNEEAAALDQTIIDRTQAAFAAAENGEAGEDISEKWARGMNDGEEWIGTYLGYDWVDTRYGRPKKRHCFSDASGRDGDRNPLVPDKDGGVVIFGMSSLDNTLREVPLGARLHVTRLGEIEGNRRVRFQVRLLGNGEVTRDRIVGRPDAPASRQQPDDWRGPRA